MVFSSKRQKKSAIGLKVAVIVTVDNVEVFHVFWHIQADAVAHGAKLVLHSRNHHTVNLFPRGQGRGNVAVGGQYRGVDSKFLKAVGDLEGLIRRTADIRKECFNGS